MPSGHSFGDYVLDVRRRRLSRGGREVHLGERALGVLKLLVENAGRVVTRQELIDTVWRDVIVSDDSLARAVSDIRTALGDDPAHARYIRTVHRRGYVFIATVKPVEDFEPEEVVATRPARQRLRVPFVLAAVVVVIGAVAVMRQLIEVSGEESSPSHTDFTEWTLRALGPHPFTATAIKPAFAKTSNMLAVVGPDPETGAHTLFLLRPDGGEPLQMTRGFEVRGPSPEFTADDSHIIFTTYHADPERGMVPDVWLAPVPAGKPRLLVENASAASTSPDGRDLVYASVSPGGTAIRVRREDGTDREVAAQGFWPRWSPDGEWIAYTTSDPEGGNGTIHVVRPDGSEHHELTDIRSQVYGLCWTPDSSRVIFASEQAGPTMLYAVDVDKRRRQAVTRGPGVCTSPTISPDGRRLVFSFSHRRWYLFLADRPGGVARRVLVEPGMPAAALSPDGRRVAVALGGEAQSPAVSLIDTDTTERRTLSGMAASAVAWMPDGRDLLIAAPAPDGVNHWIWRLPIGGGLPEPVLKGAERWEDPWPSPDGQKIAVVHRAEHGSELVVHDLADGADRTVAATGAIVGPRWSPDGTLLAWSGGWRPDEMGAGGVWVCPAEAGAPRRLTVDGAWPVWEKDGEHLLFARFLENDGIWRVPVDGGSPRLVRRLDGELQDLYLHSMGIGRAGAPVLLLLYKYTGELYALEPPDRRP